MEIIYTTIIFIAGIFFLTPKKWIEPIQTKALRKINLPEVQNSIRKHDKEHGKNLRSSITYRIYLWRIFLFGDHE